MSRCILVMGTGRSRTSCVAGMLHKLGCNMGGEFVPSDKNNPHGTYEDLELFALTRKYLQGEVSSKEFITPLAQRAKQDVWGIKDPELVKTARFIIPILRDLGVEVKTVVCKRDARDTINSYMRAYKRGRIRSEKRYEQAIQNLAARLIEFDGEVLKIDTDNLLANPDKYATKLMSFTFDESVEPERYNAARTHIKPKAKREVKGWGSLAVGVRVNKHPEPEFFKSWTALLTGGLRDYDTVLMPQYYQPAHWAATNLARSFLKTDKDSLLLVDDDMQFDMSALHNLREHKPNWDYDVVMAFCTRRSWPPEPIIFKLNPDPEEPAALKGQHHFIDSDFEWGEIVDVDVVGLAFTLIRRRVLEAMIDDKWGLQHTYFFTYGQGLESDDIPFCRKARNLGFRIGLDTGVCIEHIGRHAFGKEDFEIWRREKSDNKHLEMDEATLVDVLREAAKSDSKAGNQARAILGELNA